MSALYLLAAEYQQAARQLADLDRRFTALVVALQGASVPGSAIDDRDGALAHIYGAGALTFYLLRPDLHVASRWKTVAADEILAALRACLGAPAR